MMLASFLFTDDKIFTVTTTKNPQNDRLHAYASTKKKDVVTKYVRTQSLIAPAVGNKWLTLH